MPKIYNVAYTDITDNLLPDVGEHAALIQIVSPGWTFPTPRRHFPLTVQVNCEDSANDLQLTPYHRMLLSHTVRICSVMQMNIIVHCMAGVSRSGAIVEGAVRCLGYEDPKTYRDPNPLLLKIIFGIESTKDWSYYEAE